MDNDGARRLMAAILKQANDDYSQKNVCPTWCEYINECDNIVKNSRTDCDVKQFIKSAWCATLCDGLNVSHEEYKRAILHKRLNQDLIKYIESELRNYKQTCAELEQLKRDIIYETPEQQEGHSSAPGDPTQNKVAKILLDRRIKRYSEITSAIQTTYDKCDKQKKELIELKYWQNRYTDAGIADRMCIGTSTLKRWKKAIVLSIAIELGYL